MKRANLLILVLRHPVLLFGKQDVKVRPVFRDLHAEWLLFRLTFHLAAYPWQFLPLRLRYAYRYGFAASTIFHPG